MILEGVGLGSVSMLCPFCGKFHYDIQLVEEAVTCFCGSTVMTVKDERTGEVFGKWLKYDVLARRTERLLSDDPRNYC